MPDVHVTSSVIPARWPVAPANHGSYRSMQRILVTNRISAGGHTQIRKSLNDFVWSQRRRPLTESRAARSKRWIGFDQAKKCRAPHGCAASSAAVALTADAG